MSRLGVFAGAMLLMAVATTASADVTISTDTTQNMTCSGGICAPTASSAVLNVNDLENLLASGNVEVTTTGSGGVQANNIDIEAALTWSTASALSLVAGQAITVDVPVSVTGTGGLSITNDGQNEHLAFGSSGNVSFANLSSSLTINGAAYTLVNSVKGLASGIANNPSGDFALAGSYDARADGSYKQAPVNTGFSGTFDGLGNTISHLTVKAGFYVGLFEYAEATAVLRNVGLVNVSIHGRNQGDFAGGLVATNVGYISRCFVSGTVTGGQGSYVGGLVGLGEAGTISQSYATANVNGGKRSFEGGLIGWNEVFFTGGGVIEKSFATGAVTATKSYYNLLGGLAGVNYGRISNSYSTGAVTGGSEDFGGFVGFNQSIFQFGLLCAPNSILTSYSTGQVHGAPNRGGFLGYDDTPGCQTNSYWDTDTSGITNLSQGAGNIPNDHGITGLSTSQFQSGLPAGFDPTVWTENSSINNGLPYLINNPPPQ